MRQPPLALSWMPRPAPMVLALVLICCGIEALLQGADLHLWGSGRWRQIAYQNGGFWAGLLWGWKPNYAAQPLAMFVTHSFLHAGLGHLAGNMAALLTLGAMIRDRISPAGFALLWALSVLAGAVSFALLNTSPQPMVGTSGALFGLTGALVVWEATRRHAQGEGIWAVSVTILAWVLGLVALNLAVWWLQNGILAWEAHLGGFLAGAAWAWATTGRGRGSAQGPS
jgi:rhomboid protease GluP